MINPDWIKNIEDWSDVVMIGKYEKIVDVAQQMVENDWTIRRAAKECCMGKSTILVHIEKYLKWLDPDLYVEVKHKLKVHKKHPNKWREYLLW
jgi:hypothetical protein